MDGAPLGFILHVPVGADGHHLGQILWVRVDGRAVYRSHLKGEWSFFCPISLFCCFFLFVFLSIFWGFFLGFF